MQGEIVQPLGAAQIVALHDVLIEDGAKQGGEVTMGVQFLQQGLGISAGLRVAGAVCLRFGDGRSLGKRLEILGERKREKEYGQMTAGQMGRQFLAQQVGVAPGEGQAVALALQSIGEYTLLPVR